MTRSSSLRRSLVRRRGGGRRAERRRLILMYHRVDEPGDDPFGLAVGPERFRGHLEAMGARGRMVSLDELLRAEPSEGAPLIGVTFDDGYEDNLSVAVPLLREAGIPATFFVCTGSLGDARGFWWDRVTSAVAATAVPTVDVEGLEGLVAVDELSSPESRTRATLAIAAQLKPLAPATRDGLLDELEARLPVRPGGRRTPAPVLDEAGLRALAAQPAVTIGAHTRGHPMLSRLARDAQTAEIIDSVETIHAVTGTRPSFVAYPYGGRDDYDDDSCGAAADAGMTMAFGNHGGVIDPVSDPYRIPRYYVPPLAAHDFPSWLDGVLGS